jgi:hypothetical protein
VYRYRYIPVPVPASFKTKVSSKIKTFGNYRYRYIKVADLDDIGRIKIRPLAKKPDQDPALKKFCTGTNFLPQESFAKEWDIKLIYQQRIDHLCILMYLFPILFYIETQKNIYSSIL